MTPAPKTLGRLRTTETGRVVYTYPDDAARAVKGSLRGARGPRYPTRRGKVIPVSWLEKSVLFLYA